MSNLYENAIKRVIAYRECMQLSQAQMAKKIGLTQSHYSKIEKGTKSITNDVLLRLHKIGLDMDYIVTGIESKGSRIENLLEKCSVDRKSNFIRIIILYMNMILKSENSETLDCKNELQILEYNIDKSNGRDVGTVWNAIRKAHGLTQKEMADILDINIKSYRKVEKGILMPNVEVLTNLYEKLGYYPTLIQEVGPNYLLMLNSVWNVLSDEDKTKIEELIRYSLDYINEKFD